MSNPPPPPRPSPRHLPLGLWYQGCSFRLVSFRFSSLRISLRYARGDLGAQPPTRELVNYFAQRDTSFMLLSPLDPSLPLSLFHARFTLCRALSLIVVHAFSRSFSERPASCAYDICGEVQSGGSFQVATKCVSRRPSTGVKKLRIVSLSLFFFF